MEKLLTDKVAIVTGASRGIGRQIAMTLAQEGAYVIVNYNGSKEAAEAVVETITQPVVRQKSGSAAWQILWQ